MYHTGKIKNSPFYTMDLLGPNLVFAFSVRYIYIKCFL